MIGVKLGMDFLIAPFSYVSNALISFRRRVDSYSNSVFEASNSLYVTLKKLSGYGLLNKASLIITPNAYQASVLYAVAPNTILGDMTVTRATTGTRVNSLGYIEVVPINVPRIDYSNGSSPSLLVEPQRTNIANQSTITSFNDGGTPWINGSSAPAQINQTIGINGTQNGAKYTKSIVGGTGDFLYKSGVPVNPGTVYAISGYIKLGTAINAVIVVNNTLVWDTIPGANFVCSIANGFSTTSWKRFEIIITAPSSGLINVHYGYHVETGVAAQGNGTFFLDGLQVEAGGYPTSLIPTSVGSATRNEDVISKTGISSLIGQAEGTMFLDFKYINSSTFERMTLSNSINGARLSIGVNDAKGLQFVAFNSVGSVLLNENYTNNSQNKCAIIYTSTLIKVFVNGVLRRTVAVSFTTNFDSLSNSYNNSLGFFQPINSIQLYKTALTDAECINLTTL